MTASRRVPRSTLAFLATAVVAGSLAGCAPKPEPPPAEEPPAAAVVDDGGPVLDEMTALGLSALPLACVDRPQSAPTRTGYLYELSFQMRTGFEEDRAFYGCYDWHSAVNSTWALVALLRRRPHMPVAPLIAEKLQQHLSSSALDGEMEYFEANPGFERPYGWAWFLLLHAELTRLEYPGAEAWVESTAPLADRFLAGLNGYFERLDYPMRVGTHANTAFALGLALEHTRVVDRPEFRESFAARARALFAADTDCALAYEPSAADFLSPCLTEAELMASVLPQQELVAWLDRFLPGPESAAFRSLRDPIHIAAPDTELDVAQQGAKSHLIGLAFTRAESLVRIAAALPADDARVTAYRDTAAELARWGLETMFDADYLGSHWIGTFAVRYLIARADVAR